MDAKALMDAMASEAAKDLVSQLLVVDPRSRMSAEDVLHRVQRCQGHCDPQYAGYGAKGSEEGGLVAKKRNFKQEITTKVYTFKGICYLAGFNLATYIGIQNFNR